jgi:hypothetical protein
MVAKTGQNPAHSPRINQPASPRRAGRKQQLFTRQRPALLVPESTITNTDKGEDLTPFASFCSKGLSPLTDEDMALFNWTVMSESEMSYDFGATIANQSTQQSTKPRTATHHKQHTRHRTISAKSAAAAVFQEMRGRSASNAGLIRHCITTGPQTKTQQTLAKRGRGRPRKQVLNTVAPVLSEIAQAVLPPQSNLPFSTSEQLTKKRKRGRPRKVPVAMIPLMQ